VKTAKQIPIHFDLRPRLMTYIGPPAKCPLCVLILYLMESTASAYLVAIPNTPVSHIHRTAPGPPRAMAVATPTIFPVPIVAASAVVSAPKCPTSPRPSELFRKDRRIAFPI